MHQAIDQQAMKRAVGGIPAGTVRRFRHWSGMARPRHHSIFELAAGMAFAAPHVAITLAWRWPMLLGGPMPSAATRREMARMVLEKASAAVAGALDGQKVALRLGADAFAGKLKPTDMASAPAAIAVANLQPALRRIRSNSKRLSRKRPGR